MVGVEAHDLTANDDPARKARQMYFAVELQQCSFRTGQCEQWIEHCTKASYA
jgi:hypothetical protein